MKKLSKWPTTPPDEASAAITICTAAAPDVVVTVRRYATAPTGVTALAT